MKVLLHIACWLVVAAAGFLAAQTPPSPDFSDVEDFLNQGETARRQTIATQLHALTSELTPLLSSNLKLLDAYKDAYANVFFEGAKKEHSKVKEWEERNKCDDYDRIVAEIRRVIAEARKASAAP